MCIRDSHKVIEEHEVYFRKPFLLIEIRTGLLKIARDYPALVTIETEFRRRVVQIKLTYRDSPTVIFEKASRLHLNLWYQLGKRASQKRHFDHFHSSAFTNILTYSRPLHVL